MESFHGVEQMFQAVETLSTRRLTPLYPPGKGQLPAG